MDQANDISYEVPFTSDSNLSIGFHVSAALGGGAPHAFLVDTGSVGILVPRQVLGPDYQDFDPSQDVEFGYISSGNVYRGQWVKVPVVLGVPAEWDGTGDYPIAHGEVFAVDQPAGFDGGLLGIGFGIGGLADGGPASNPLLHVAYREAQLGHGYIISTQGINIGRTPSNTDCFLLIPLDRNPSGNDWMQPLASVSLTDDFSADGFSTVLPLLVDTGIDNMILWMSADSAPPNLPSDSAFPGGIAITASAPPADEISQPAFQYSFVTGDVRGQTCWRALTTFMTRTWDRSVSGFLRSN